MSGLLDMPGDAERRVALKRMRMIATSLLVLAAIIYLVTLRPLREGWLGFVNAGSEAAMVGALADWFAVTALFRHPLGIPIPHTALIKRRKDDLGRSLQQFVTNNFLTEANFRERLASAQLGLKVSEWLSNPAHRRRVLTELVKLGRLGLGRVNDDDVEQVLTDAIIPRLKREPLAPIAGAFLDGVVRDDAHRGLVDLGISEIERWLVKHPDKFNSVVENKAPGWSPSWLDRRVVDWSYGQALDWVRAVRLNRNHPARKALNDMLLTMADNLQHDESVRARGEALKERVLDHPQTGATARSLWESVKGSLEGAMDDTDSSLWTRADRWLAEVGRLLGEDPELRDRFEERTADVVAFLINRYGPQVATVISYTVDRWDAQEASDKIELFVGKDLQYIRINGTVVGALAGLAIHAVSLLVR